MNHGNTWKLKSPDRDSDSKGEQMLETRHKTHKISIVKPPTPLTKMTNVTLPDERVERLLK